MFCGALVKFNVKVVCSVCDGAIQHVNGTTDNFMLNFNDLFFGQNNIQSFNHGNVVYEAFNNKMCRGNYLVSSSKSSSLDSSV